MSKWMTQNRHLYPSDWPTIANRVKAEAGWKCLVCGAPHAPKRVLTVHHLDHDPKHCEDDNLLACCQSCHLRFQHIKPYPTTRAEAIERWKALLATAESQGRFFSSDAEPTSFEWRSIPPNYVSDAALHEDVTIFVNANDRYIDAAASRIASLLTGTVVTSEPLSLGDGGATVQITGTLRHRATCADPLAFVAGRENCTTCGRPHDDHIEPVESMS